MIRFTFLVCLFVAITPYVYAMTDEQRAAIRQHFEEVGLSCMKESPIEAEDVAALRSKQMPSGANVPCFMACMLRTTGVMDDKGMLQRENALELAKKVFHDEEEIKSIHDYLHSCSHINTEPVSDGEKGCDRAMLSYKCMLENAEKFGFDL